MNLAILKILLLSSLVSLLGCGPQDDDANDGDKPNTTRFSDIANSGSTLVNLSQIVSTLNLGGLHRQGHRGDGVKVAIFDNGFTGLDEALGTRLPPDLYVQPAPKNEPLDTIHGAKLAEIVYAVASGSVAYQEEMPGPQLYLYNTNGYTNLQAAITDAMNRGVNMILYAQIWEYGGNMDGSGFINDAVASATQSGILWVNASGNYGRAMHKGSVSLDNRGYLKFSNDSDKLHFTTTDEKTDIKISLGWNDFTSDPLYRTSEDLDLYLYNAKGEELVAAERIQDGSPQKKGHSAHAYEKITLTVKPGRYYIKIKAKAPDAFDDSSRYWVAINGPKTEIEPELRTDGVLMPADGQQVLAVAAQDVNFSSTREATATQSAKPEIQSISRVLFDDGQSFAGTSAASAITAGALAAYMSNNRRGFNYSDAKFLIGRGQIATSRDTGTSPAKTLRFP